MMKYCGFVYIILHSKFSTMVLYFRVREKISNNGLLVIEDCWQLSAVPD